MRHTSTILIVDDEVRGRKTREGLLSNALAAQAAAAHFLDMSLLSKQEAGASKLNCVARANGVPMRSGF
jgi:hypothetical protein